MSDHRFGPPGLPSPRPARWSLTPPCLCLSWKRRRRIRASRRHWMREDPHRDPRPSRGHCAARISRAQGASRCTGFAPPALRAADGLDRASCDPCPGNYRRPERKCLTTVGGGATVGSSSLAAVRSPLHIARCGACSNRRSQTTVRSLFSNHFLIVCWCDVTSANRQPNRTALRSQARRRSDRARHVQSSRCHGGTPVRSRCVGRCAQRAHHREQQRHRRSEWAGVSWPKDDRDERDAAGGIGLARERKATGEMATAPTPHFVRSFVHWRDRPRASASSWN